MCVVMGPMPGTTSVMPGWGGFMFMCMMVRVVTWRTSFCSETFRILPVNLFSVWSVVKSKSWFIMDIK